MGDEAQGEALDVSRWKTNRGVGIILTVIFLVLLGYLLNQEWVYNKLRDGFHLGTFTVAAAVCMLLCSITFIVDRHKAVVEEEMVKVSGLDAVVALVTAVTAYAYFLLAWQVDFLAITPIFLCAAMYTLGVRPLRTAIIVSVIGTGTIFGLFFLLGIRLPSFLTS